MLIPLHPSSAANSNTVSSQMDETVRQRYLLDQVGLGFRSIEKHRENPQNLHGLFEDWHEETKKFCVTIIFIFDYLDSIYGQNYQNNQVLYILASLLIAKLIYRL